MSNSILTPLMITRESLRVLHSKLSFLGNVNRQYDDRFAQTGAKIGNTLNIRMPSKYTVRKTATLAAQDHVERSAPLSVQNQYGVDVTFSTAELTLSLDDFSKRVLDPAMSQLAAQLEGECIAAAMKYVSNFTGTTTTALDYRQFQQMGQYITENLGPTSDRSALLNPLSRVEFSDAVKGLFQDSQNIKSQYRDGLVGRTGGFEVFENTLIPSHTIGSLAGTPLTKGAALGVSATTNTWEATTTFVVDGATSGTTIKAGDVLTFGTVGAGLVECHPETKMSLGRLKRFVVQNDVTLTSSGTGYDVTVMPAAIWGSGNAYQNCILTGSDTDDMTVTNWGAASTSVGQNLAFHKDAFVFATADLEDVSKFGAWGARDSMDGISMRIGRQWDISNDTIPCRIDVLWGFGPLYPELASKQIHKLS